MKASRATSDLRGRESVERWISTVDAMYHLSDEEWAPRLEVLAAFCAATGADPDRMVVEARADRRAKDDHLRRLKRFAGERHSPGSREAHDAENVVRSFLIHNGARVFVRPYEL